MVLGVDGMDYRMTSRLMAEGKMPNFTRLSQKGTYKSLETSVPPLSPVAWSGFMTGLDSGGHGIFDFLHRNPSTMIPEFSMSKTIPPDDYWSIGSWKIPTDNGKLINLRQGEVFWKQLQNNGVSSTIIRMPANYPPAGVGEKELSGMGTPDIHGGYGEFTYITSKFGAGRKKIEGGEIQEVWEENGTIEAKLIGPLNPFKDPNKKVFLEIPMQIIVDNDQRSIKINIDGKVIQLNVRQWSEWVPIEFEMLPIFGDLHGIVKFYLRTVRPHLELYISPINFDPMNPDTIISEPSDYAIDLAEQTGRFYTQGMPEDTKALEAGILNREEFFTQAKIAGNEIIAQLKYVIVDFLKERRSFLFYYIGHLDQISHMTWKSTDPDHPFYDPKTDPYWAKKLEDLYVDIDTLVGDLVRELDGKADLVVMSDHGFAPWRRDMDLNGWLLSEGFLVLKNGKTSSGEFFQDVDWNKTKAYGVGFNGLYLNVKSREKFGIVKENEKEFLLNEIRDKLLNVIDPSTGEAAITKVYRSDHYYKNKQDHAPDLIVGYAYGTRGSSESALGAVAKIDEIFKDHSQQWSGDHSMDHETVPGILLTTKKFSKNTESLTQLPVLILNEFGLKPIISKNLKVK
ncbi:MAG: alkaline phosphatase family protein [Marinicellaceae bacterium]